VPAPLLEVESLVKRYARGVLRRQATFSLEAHFTIEAASIVGILGPNGSGKTTLFELVTGSNRPTAGHVRVVGRDVHRIRYDQRDRLAIHYHQSYQVRSFKGVRPSWLLEPARSDYPHVHLFDEPQLSTQDGYVGFMLDFFRKLRGDGRLVLLCLHPNERWQLDILRDTCERFIFVDRGRLTHAASFAELVRDPRVAAYLGALATDPGPDGARG
jgi:ABC-type branched-subunit amino acid transport system ATPase component